MEVALKSFRTESKSQLLGGIITGQIAGLIMAVVVMLVFVVVYGKSPLFPVQVIGSAALGESALEGTNLLAVFMGLVLHQLGPSLLWGALYGYLATKFTINDTKSALILGLVVGVIAMVGPYVLIPFVMKSMHRIDYWNREVPIVWDWAAHLVFGASFVLYPVISNRINTQNYLLSRLVPANLCVCRKTPQDR